jgi:hypothetical protein
MTTPSSSPPTPTTRPPGKRAPAEAPRPRTTYRGQTPPPTVRWRPATPEQAQRLAAALDALIRGWAMTEARLRLNNHKTEGEQNDAT